MSAEISVIVPLCNEAENVQPLVREIFAALRDERRAFELLLVDDGSTDATWQRIQAAREDDPRVRALRHERNLGQSAALWTGFRASESPIIATLDGDRQNDPADFPAMLARIGEFDLVCGVRTRRQDNFKRKFSSRIARAANQAILGVQFNDPGCGIRVFRRTALDGLFPFNGFHRFLAVLVQGGGGKVCEVPVNHRPRVAGVSKYGVMNRAGRGMVDLLAIAWFQKRRIKFPPTV